MKRQLEYISLEALMGANDFASINDLIHSKWCFADGYGTPLVLVPIAEFRAELTGNKETDPILSKIADLPDSYFVAINEG